jgi:hypothetical protein
MLAGTVASASSARDPSPSVASIAAMSAERGPRWRGAKVSEGASEDGTIGWVTAAGT